MDTVETHPFAHLGPAPYTFRGVWSMPSKSLQSANPAAYNAAMREAPRGAGSCDHCGAALTNHYLVLDGAGKTHVVGSSCINQTKKPGYRVPRLVADAMKAKREMDRAKKAARDKVKLQELEELMSNKAIRNELSRWGHSRGFKCRETGRPLTWLDEAEWMIANSGVSGKLRTLKAIKKILK